MRGGVRHVWTRCVLSLLVAEHAHSVHDPKVVGDLAYFSWYRDGIVVADISRPAKPKIVASFVPPSREEREWIDQMSRGGELTRTSE